MEHKIKELEKSQLQITITVSENEMQQFEKKAADLLSKDVKVKGFRPGHVPPHVLENYIDKKYITAHTQEIAIQESYVKTILQEKIQPVSRPKIKIEKDKPFTFTATVATLPEVELKDHESIKIPKKEVKVTEKDISAVLDDMKKYATTYKDIDRAAKKGDRAEIDFEGFDENKKSVPNTKSKNHPVILGQNTLIPGFEDNIVGMKKGEEKEFDITFPKDYQKKDFQNKKLKFKIKLNRLEEPEKVEITEELIEKLTGKKQTPEELKKDIEKNLKAKKEEESKHQRENEYIEKLLTKTKVEIPPPMIEEEAQYILEDMKKDIEKKGVEFAKFLEQSKTTEEKLRERYKKEAERRLKIRLAIQELIKKEDINVSDDELKKEFQKLKAMYPEKEHKKLEAEFDKGEIAIQLKNRLLLGKLFDKVLT